jgi:hypothetical protein
MRVMELDSYGVADEDRIDTGSGAGRELLSALAGKQADRDTTVAQRTRRVVSASLGVMQDQKAGRKRNRSLALAALVLVLFAVGPILWRLTDDLVGGEHICDMPAQVTLLVCVLGPALVAAALLAGGPRRNS